MAKKPNRLFIEVIGRYDWLFEKLVEYGETENGNAHCIIVSSERIKNKYFKLLKNKESIVYTIDDIDNFCEAKKFSNLNKKKRKSNYFEVLYSCRYQQDIMQQDRSLWARKVAFAANTWTSAKIEPDEAIIEKLSNQFEVLEELFLKFKPDMVIARPGWTFSTIATIIARKQKIPTTMPRPARKGSLVTWTIGPYSHPAQLEYLFNKSTFQPAEKIETKVLPPEGSRQVFANFQKTYEIKNICKRLFVEAYNHAVFFLNALMNKKLSKRPKFSRFLKRFYLELRTLFYLKKIWIDNPEKINGKKILFLLPKEPEYTVQSLARDFCNIHAIVTQIATCLPAGSILLVKEHSRFGYRSINFYKELNRFENIRFANPLLPSSHFFTDCDATATIAGTVGIESCLMGKKCLIFSNRVEYNFLPNIRFVENIRELPYILDELFTKPSTKEVLEYKTAATKYYSLLNSVSFDAAGTWVFEGEGKINTEIAAKAWELLCENYNFQIRKLKNNYDFHK